MLIFRPGALRRLQAHLNTPGPGIVLVRGARSLGKTFLVRKSLEGREALWQQGSALPHALQAREHGVRLGSPDCRDWADFGAALQKGIADGAFEGSVLVWDRADGLLRDPRWREMLESVWAELRARARPVHLVLIVREPVPADALASLAFVHAPGTPLTQLHLHPLGLRAATAGFETWSALQRVTAYTLLGGEPAVWDRLDPQVRLSTNLIRLLLEPGGPLRTFVGHRFPVPGRSPERALALIHALANGAQEWGEMKEAAGVFRTSSELGPYVQALRDAGLVEARQSLDARPGSRNRRYALAPEFVQSWHALFRPQLATLDGGASPARVWKEQIRPAVPDLAARRFPGLIAAYLREHGEERFRARAREDGGLWGEGPEIPVAATLMNGAVVYGATSWKDPGEEGLQHLSRQVAETRYGYGRESRIVTLFVAQPVAWTVERSVARQTNADLLGPNDLTGNGKRSGE